MLDYNQFISPLDTERFGFKVAKVNDFTRLSPRDLIAPLRKEGVRLIISRVDASNIPLINSLEMLRFKCKDTQVRHRLWLKEWKKTASRLHPNVAIRQFKENQDIFQIVDIAKSSFNGYGHYFADEKLDRKKCLEVYSDWAKNCCMDNSVADLVFVVTINQKVVGFFAIKEDKINKELHSVLVAVHPNYRNQGFFTEMLSSIIKHGVREGFVAMTHDALLNNYYVNRVLSSNKFIIGETFMTLHCWI